MDGKGTVVLLSGGMDSTVAAFWALRTFGRPLHVLGIEYGQRHWIELEKAREVCGYLRPDSARNVSLGPPGVGLRGGALTKAHGEITEASSVVPGRNLMFLIKACGHALQKGAARIVIGCCGDDAATYADCREETLEAMGQALRLGMEWPGTVHAPLVGLSKKEVVDLAWRLGDDCAGALSKSWSCYDPQRDSVRDNINHVRPCDKCPACVKRAAGFAAAGQPDPARRVPRDPVREPDEHTS